MTAAQARVKGAIQASGENYLTGSSVRRGLFSILRPGQARDFLSDLDIDSAGRPIRIAYVPYDDTTAAGVSVTVGGVTQTVVKTVDLRYLAAVIARAVVLT